MIIEGFHELVGFFLGIEGARRGGTEKGCATMEVWHHGIWLTGSSIEEAINWSLVVLGYPSFVLGYPPGITGISGSQHYFLYTL